MNAGSSGKCQVCDRYRERDRIGVWGFGNVSTDVVVSLIDEGLGKEIVLYGRPKEHYPNRAGAWVEDLKANTLRRPRIVGTNRVEDMAGLDVIFIGAGVPRKEGQSRRDLLATNVEIIAQTSLEIKRLYEDCSEEDLPVLIYMGNPVTTMTWVGYKATSFPRSHVLGQAGNLDSRRICHALSGVLGLSGNEILGIVFGDHGDSMVASPRFFSISGIPLNMFAGMENVPSGVLTDVIDTAKKGGTHYVNETGRSASAGPARAACDMLRCIIHGQPEVQSVVAVLTREYDLLQNQDGLDSIGFGVPVRIGRNGIEKIYELPVDDLRDQLLASAAIIKDDIRHAASILREKFSIT